MIKASNDYTPRENKPDNKLLKNSGNNGRGVKNNNNLKQKKDNNKLTSKGVITASGGVVVKPTAVDDN